MNIAVISNTLLKGGAEKQSLLLVKNLKDKYNIFLIVLYGDQVEKEYLDFIKFNKINLILIKGNLLKKIIALFRIFRDNEIDMVFSYLLKGNLISGICGRLAGIEFIYGGIRSSRLPFIKLFVQKIMHLFLHTKTITNSYAAKNYLVNNGFSYSKIVVIPNSVGPIPKSINHTDDKAIRILTVARFDKSKDYFTSLLIIKSISEKIPRSIKLEYYIVGYGKLKKQILKKIKFLSLQEIVKVIENPTNVSQYYRISNVYLSTSLFEGMSNSILEAMSYSLPIIATDVGDNNQIVADGENGFLLPIKNFSSITEKLLLLCSNSDMRTSMGKKSYEFISTNFSSEIFRKRYINLIENEFKA